MRRTRGRGAKWVLVVALASACDDADEPGARDAGGDAGGPASADAAGLTPADAAFPDALGRTGVLGPEPLFLVPDVTAHDFDLAIGARGERRLTFTNVGAIPLGPLFTGLEPNVEDFLLTDGCTAKVLAAGEACTMDVLWTPQTVSSFDSRLFVAVAGGGGFRVEVALRGRVRLLETPFVVVPTTHDFGAIEVGEESAVVEISLTTPVALASSALTAMLSQVGDFRIASDGCTGRSLAANERCAVGVTYAPRTLGAHGATLLFSQTGGGSSSARLSGFGAAPPLGPSP